METIAAIATAQSPSAIGIVRLSGEETRRVLAALFTPASGMAVEALPYRRMTYGDTAWWVTAMGEVPLPTLQAFIDGIERKKPL